MNQLITKHLRNALDPEMCGSYPLKLTCVTKRSFSYSLLIFTLGLVSSNFSVGQSIDDIVLRLRNSYSFSMGYRESGHKYEAGFIENAVTKPTSRKFIASILQSIKPTPLRQESTKDGGQCPKVELRLMPSTVVAFLYTLQKKSHGNWMTIQKEERKLPGYPRHEPGHTCILIPKPSTRPFYPNEGEVEFTVPLPTNQAIGVGDLYRVILAIMGGNNSVLARHVKEITIPRTAPLIVSVGDSYSSGEGNPDKKGNAAKGDPLSKNDCAENATFMYATGSTPDMGVNPQWLDKKFHRSLRSGPALAADDLTKDYPFLMFLSFAKSGAEVFTTDDEKHILKQLEEVKETVGNHQIDALIISIGANDLGFARNIKSMAKSFKGNGGHAVAKSVRAGLVELENVGYPSIDSKIRQLGLHVGKVFIMEYSGHLFNDRNGRPRSGCEVFETAIFWRVSAYESRILDSLGNELNQTIQNTARKLDWKYVGGISSQFLTHGYCSGQNWYVKAAESCESQGDFDGTMHPNERGTKVIRDAIRNAVKTMLTQQGGVFSPALN